MPLYLVHRHTADAYFMVAGIGPEVNVIRIEAAFPMDWAMILAFRLQNLRPLMSSSGTSFHNALEIVTALLVGPRCAQSQGTAFRRYLSPTPIASAAVATIKVLVG